MDIKEIEELIQSGRNTPLTRFPNEPPKVELHTVVDVSAVCASAGRHTNELISMPNILQLIRLSSIYGMTTLEMMIATEFVSEVENICRICRLEKAEQQDLIEKIISLSERAHRRPVEVSRIVSERLRFGMSLDYALVWTEAIILNSSEKEDNS